MPHTSHITTTQALLSPGLVPGIPISRARSASAPIAGRSGSAKRVLDIALAVVLLAVLGIPMLLIAVAIWVDTPGPALFRQWRMGLGNIGFHTLKFRTMYQHPPERGLLQQTTRDDPRVTRLGAMLRRSSLDELPQLFNVLRGDMSMVGPRPHAPGTCAGGKPFELITPRYAARHRVRPGMTGLAQIRGWRGETETEGKLLCRLEADLEYIEKWSLWLDFEILLRTAIAMLSMRNAY
jgi:polysaccharide biosynthesis protein PslA